MKILTFIIPAYNSAHFLDTVIPSMLVPEILDKLEIIVVNDGSTDGTAAAAEKYCQKYPDTVRLISQENKGHGGALNTGCAAATGKYLKVVDADDWVETKNLPKLIKILEQCESDVVLTHYRTFDISNGEVKDFKITPEVFQKPYDLAEITAHYHRFANGTTFHGILYRTAFYQEKGILLTEHIFYEDHEYATLACCHAKSITALDLFLYIYRIGDVNQSVSHSNQLKRIDHIKTVFQRLTKEYRRLPQNVSKEYAAMKAQGVLLSYLTTALLLHPDKKTGRKMARTILEKCKLTAPAVYELTKRKAYVLFLMNRLHISKELWSSLLHSKPCTWLRKTTLFRKLFRAFPS